MVCRMKSPKDKIHVIICEQPNLDTKKVEDVVTYHLEEEGHLPVSHVCILPSNHGQKTKDIIRDHLIDDGTEDVDIVVVGNKGADFSSRDVNRYIGSVANEVIRHTKLNCLFFI
jgi:nucleotide-binding universal stress UspA family protein